jgi:hypothetical protein
MQAAQLTRIVSATNVFATNGITIAGQTFDGSPDGTIQGQRSVQPVTANADGSYTFQVPPATIAMLQYT